MMMTWPLTNLILRWNELEAMMVTVTDSYYSDDSQVLE
jgi:hypothetical protein